jgi:hypothetical protein
MFPQEYIAVLIFIVFQNSTPLPNGTLSLACPTISLKQKQTYLISESDLCVLLMNPLSYYQSLDIERALSGCIGHNTI